MITDCRGHRLFGPEMPPPYNDEDLRGRNCLITVSGDSLLRTLSEHEYGMSIWCPRDEMDRGAYVVLHLTGSASLCVEISRFDRHHPCSEKLWTRSTVH